MLEKLFLKFAQNIFTSSSEATSIRFMEQFIFINHEIEKLSSKNMLREQWMQLGNFMINCYDDVPNEAVKKILSHPSRREGLYKKMLKYYKDSAAPLILPPVEQNTIALPSSEKIEPANEKCMKEREQSPEKRENPHPDSFWSKSKDPVVPLTDADENKSQPPKLHGGAK